VDRAASRGGQTYAKEVIGKPRPSSELLAPLCGSISRPMEHVQYRRYVMLLEMSEMAAGVVGDTETHPVKSRSECDSKVGR
jgi:hypothetical protein